MSNLIRSILITYSSVFLESTLIEQLGTLVKCSFELYD